MQQHPFLFFNHQFQHGCSCLAKHESTQIMKTQTEIQTVNPKDSTLMIPPPSGVLSKSVPPKNE
jgi:hypothetical protein